MNGGSMGPIAMGLAAAMAWGAGDFSGGLASRRNSVYAVTIWAEFIGLVVLLILALFSGEPAMAWQNWLLAAIAGVAGGFGLMLLYRALADGQMTIAAPISAVMGGIIPVLVSAVWLGLPGPLTLLGMFLALGAIWLISGGPASDQNGGVLGRLQMAQVRLPLIAGVTFGLYFVLIHRASADAFYWPLIAARISSVICLTAFAMLTRRSWIPAAGTWWLVALSGLMDTGGNGFYVLAGQMGRLDVAAVLASLYPGITAALAWLVLKERLSPLQLLGVAAAFLAIILITV